jgi:hypothetical protein
VAAAALALGGIGTVEAQAAKRPLRLALSDPVFSDADGSTRAFWLDRALAARTDSIRLLASWRGIADGEPANPVDPADPSYDWSSLDAAVRSASARGLRIFITIDRAPPWAEGSNRDPDAEAGTWRPDPGKLARFSTAIATRFSGSYPAADPLPPVREWQVWAEPNVYGHLNPAYVRDGGKWRAASPDHYRRMLNAAYDALKAVSASNLVIGGGTAPFGDQPGEGRRVPPFDFWRDVLCLRGKKLKKAPCPGGSARLDALAHHPLPWLAGGGPWSKAAQLANPGDLLVPDVHKLKRLLRKARKRHTIQPRRGTQLWVTELLWESNPPNAALGRSLAQHANYLADALYLLWRQGVSDVMWRLIVDHGTRGSGLYLEDRTAKPALQAFRFPFVALRSKGKTKVWGRAPVAGGVTIQQVGGGTVATLGTGASNVFSGKLDVGGELRAVASNGDKSLSRRPR